jgi:D-ribose pyranose/furanose isomerase RbsD
MAKSKKDSIDNALPVPKEDQNIDPEIYNGVARCAQLLSIQLIESNFNISPSFFEEAIADRHMKIDVENVHASFDDENRIATCVFHLETYHKIARRKVFSLKDKFIVFYHIDNECDDFHALAFANRTGFMAAYPYFRSHVAQTASLAAADIPVLPTVSSMPVGKKIREEAQ